MRFPTLTTETLVPHLGEEETERRGLHRWATRGGTVLLVAHVALMALAGFTQVSGPIPYLATLLGLVAVPLCSWQASRRLDRWIDRLTEDTVVAVLARLLIGGALCAFAPLAYGVLGDLPLPLLGRILELGTVALSVAVMAGLVLVSLGVADLIYWLTAHVKHLSSRMMVLLLVTALAHFFWLSLLGLQAQSLLAQAIEQGRLQPYLEGMEYLERAASVYLGGLAGAIGLELPFILVVAWRFGKRATDGLRELRAGFDRVAKGKLDRPVEVTGNDEVADMQRGFNSMLEATRERQFLESAFGRYVSPVVLERLREQGGRDQMVGERRVATVLFSDIRGFTALSASLAPEEVIAVLNTYMSRMIDTIARYDGYINKFVGDSIMVVWNAPLDQPDHALRALACARAMQVELDTSNDIGMFGDLERIEMGIGVNTGPLVAGNLGNERQVEFTVLGDTVNVASRACSHASASEIVMTRAVVDGAREITSEQGSGERLAVSSLGPVEIKGKGRLELFDLVGMSEELEDLLTPAPRNSILPADPSARI